MRFCFFAFSLLALPACVSQVMPLLPDAPPAMNHTDLSLDVVTRLAGARDPLPMAGSALEFSELERAVGQAVMKAAAPWAEAHRGQREGGWQIQVELIKADASYSDAQARATLGVRATLRGVVGQVFIGQTQVFSSTAGAAKTELEARDVVSRCVGNIGRNVSGWLDGMQP